MRAITQKQQQKDYHQFKPHFCGNRHNIIEKRTIFIKKVLSLGLHFEQSNNIGLVFTVQAFKNSGESGIYIVNVTGRVFCDGLTMFTMYILE